MDLLDIVAERAPLRRRIVILDAAYRIVRIQLGSALDDRIFGFAAAGERLSPHLENLIRRGCSGETVVCTNGITVRIFTFVEKDQPRIGLILERTRRRSSDARRT